MGKERDLDIMPVMHSPFPVSPVDNITEGFGLQVRIGESHAEIFPGTRAARAELAGDRAHMTNVTHIAVENDTLNLYGETDDHHTALRIGAESLVFAKRRKQPAVPARSETGVMESAVVPQAPTPAELPDTVGNPVSEEDERTAERERVGMTGRIGYAPQFRETARGTLVGQFALAVHGQPGETTWHSVVTFGARAQKLKESGLGKGDEVEIVGYTHDRERTDSKPGEAKTITEIHAVVVRLGKVPGLAQFSPKRYTEAHIDRRSTGMLTLNSVQQAEEDVQKLLEEELPNALPREELIQRTIERGHREDAAGIAVLSLEQQGLIWLTKDKDVIICGANQEAESPGAQARV